MADIFLSYANRDADRIKPLVEVLEQQDWSVWWDYKIRVGKKFDQVIEEEIALAKCIVVVWSKESVKSDWVKGEADEGKRRQILAPALIDNVNIPLEFRRIESARLYDWKGDRSHPELQLLLAAIGEIIGLAPRQATSEKSEGQGESRKWLNIRFSKRNKIAISLIAIFLFLIGAILVIRHFYPPIDTFLKKEDGDGQLIPVGGWKNFAVKVVNGRGEPLMGEKIAWQTPECGLQVYVGETDKDGISSATNMCNTLSAGIHTQTAVLVKKETPRGFTNVERITPIGKQLIFQFQFQ